ncbi:MAG: L,D-transpeptidase family protein [Bdellovibrionales bacterium]|nr:L,D-transpeptidase family protein [Bdellovibrionales bacterium]
MKRAGFCLIVGFTLLATSASASPVDQIRVKKSERKLELLSGAKVVRTYSISLGGTPVGPKRCQGDSKTPEGVYKISGRNQGSAYHKSLRISYPSAADRKIASVLKCPPGGDIMIHGLPNGKGWIGKFHRLSDWTDGCIAVTNSEIEEIWRLVPDKTPIRIDP